MANNKINELYYESLALYILSCDSCDTCRKVATELFDDGTDYLLEGICPKSKTELHYGMPIEIINAIRDEKRCGLYKTSMDRRL